MLHGFPESWYSWRHQFRPLAEAGYHAVAPDMRGYGNSDRPTEISAYNQVEVVNDIIGLIPALGYESAIVIGHDWGAPTAWSCALHHPDKVSAVGALSVPFTPRAEQAPMATMRQMFKDTFFYQLYFQEPGVAEAEFDFFVGEFTRSGFRGPLNYYRNHDLTWELTRGAPSKISQPAMFVAGERDGVILMAADALKKLPQNVPNLLINELIPDIGHWTQQEAADQVNDAILRFLSALAADDA